MIASQPFLIEALSIFGEYHDFQNSLSVNIQSFSPQLVPMDSLGTYLSFSDNSFVSLGWVPEVSEKLPQVTLYY